MEKSISFDKANKILHDLKIIIGRLNIEQGNIAQIDIDLALEKTRRLYEILLQSYPLDNPEIESSFNSEADEESMPETVQGKQVMVSEPSPEREMDKDGLLFGKEELTWESANDKKENPSRRSSVNLFTPSLENTKHEKTTIVDKISETLQDKSIGDVLQKDKIDSLKQAIGINEKFFFINELFDGNMKEYSLVLEELDSLNSFDETISTLDRLIVSNNWNKESEALALLKEFIERKFK